MLSDCSVSACFGGALLQRAAYARRQSGKTGWCHECALPREVVEARLLFVLTTLAVVASLLLGGGTRSGFLADAILQFACLPLVCLVIVRYVSERATLPASPALISLLILAVPALQLIPLPPGWLHSGEMGAILKETRALAGIEPGWRPISVDPDATVRGLLSVIPPLAIFCAVTMLAVEERRRLVLLIIVAGLASAALGMLQVAQGTDSPLRPFEITNPFDSVGLFANRNHYAAFIYVALMFAMAWMVSSAIGAKDQGRSQLISPTLAKLSFGFVVIVILASAQVFSRSRGGVALTGPALLAGFAFAFWDNRLREATTGFLAAAAGTLIIVFVFAQSVLYRLTERFETIDFANDTRIQFSNNTLREATANLPFGTGIGTFVPVYAVGQPIGETQRGYANRAHNDWAEWVLEGGIPSLIVLAVIGLLFALRMRRLWQPVDADGLFDRNLERAGALAILLLLVHSLVDYPLRTNAIMAVAALSAGLVMVPSLARQPAPSVASSTRQRQQRPAPVRPTPSPSFGRNVEGNGGTRWSSDAAWPDAWKDKPGQDT